MAGVGFGGEPQGRQGIHITDVSQFRSCRFRWNIGSHLRMNLEPKKFVAPLWLGTGIHEALAAYYGEGIDLLEAFGEWTNAGKKAFEKINPGVELGPMEDSIELGYGMLSGYVSFAQANDDFEVVAAEKRFFIPNFVSGEPLEGRGDLLILRGGILWIMEHKTAIQHDTERLLLEEQPGCYQIAMQAEYDQPIMGTYYNFLRKKIPTMPKVLQAGTLSMNKAIDTTPEVYTQAVIANGEDPADYVDFIDMLKVKVEERPFYYREEVVRNPSNLKILWEGLQATGREMLDPNLVIYASPDIMKCKMCPMQGPCIAYHDGQDWKFILEQTMVERTEDYAREGTEEEAGHEWEL